MNSPLSISTRVVLASASPARLDTLRRAGLDPEVMVSGVDESTVTSTEPSVVAAELAKLKARAVLDRLSVEGSVVLIGCDSILEIDGVAYGKPHDAPTATSRWQAMRGQSAVLHTGHHVVARNGDGYHELTDVASTTVHFAELSDTEIEHYVSTGEPLDVAGAFTIDALGGAFITGIEGDPHNVVGISLPLLRVMLAKLGVAWTTLWS